MTLYLFYLGILYAQNSTLLHSTYVNIISVALQRRVRPCLCQFLQNSDMLSNSTRTPLLYGWLSGMQEHMLLHTRRNNEYQVLHKHSCFSWWWTRSCPKHVQERNNILRKIVHQVGFIYKVMFDRFSMPVWNQYFCMDAKHGLSQVKLDVRYKSLLTDA